jgi:hypothetical protein
LKKRIALATSFVAVCVIPALTYFEEAELIRMALAYGVGKFIVVVALSCMGLLYKPNRDMGFIVALAAFTTFFIINGLRNGFFDW